MLGDAVAEGLATSPATRTILATSVAPGAGGGGKDVKVRNYLSDRKGMHDHFMPRELVTHVIKAVVLSISSAAAPHMEEALNDPNSAGDDDGMPDWDAVYNAVFNHQLPGRIARNLVRTLAQLTLHRQLEAWCIRKASLKLAGQLMKDPVKSAVRKAAKMGSVRAAKAMLKTSALSNALLYSTNLFIDEVGMLLEWLLPHQHVSERREVLKYAKIQVASSVLGFTFCTLGMAVGTLILPGQGTFWGGICGDLVPLLILQQ
mmetsp:Transcript_62400/g.171551  ORF Transcript_62400/g.171551 Transcript_62400/m.171551 type:complete len:260 (+) Transcript_62400:3-782(+)